MHSFTNAIPILVLLGASAIATPILHPADCVIQDVTFADPCTMFAKWGKGEATCPASMANSVFGELLKECCDNDRQRTGTGRVNEDDALTGAIDLSDTGSNRKAAPRYHGVFNSLGGSEKNDGGIDIEATMDGNGGVLNDVVNGDVIESSDNRRSGLTGNRHVGPNGVLQGDADVNAEDITENNRQSGNSDNSRAAQDGTRLSGLVSGNNGLTDGTIQTGNGKTDTSDGSRTQVEVEKHECNVNAAVVRN